MLFQTSALILPLALGAIARSTKHQNPFKATADEDTGCGTGVHIIGVRGTLEEPGFGALENVTIELKKQIPGSSAYAIEYPANGISKDGESIKYNFFEYSSSVAQGYGALITHIEDFTEICPETKIVLMGYSQGAQVVGDVLCGANGILFPHKVPIDDFYKENIHAIIQLGDPTNRKDEPWHLGNSTHSGIFFRADLRQCRDLGDKWQSYCDANDLFCDSGDSVPVHLGYVAEYLDEIVSFVVEKSKSTSKDFWNFRANNQGL